MSPQSNARPAYPRKSLTLNDRLVSPHHDTKRDSGFGIQAKRGLSLFGFQPLALGLALSLRALRFRLTPSMVSSW
jgi:hypothetical protein